MRQQQIIIEKLNGYCSEATIVRMIEVSIYLCRYEMFTMESPGASDLADLSALCSAANHKLRGQEKGSTNEKRTESLLIYSTLCRCKC